MKKSKRKSENTSRQIRIKIKLSKMYETRKSNSKKGVYSDTGLPLRNKKNLQISNKPPNLLPKV